mmetsp:Transcript_19692/g.33603  ORF Transcript_19692/g.33603 Transcript_19692/m.33603 type:complete len:177 (-) Transcript_19692:118-648(-)|eukprot:scaffold4146_cov91-Skeletonema_marinoi.AAC.2
MSCDTGVSSSGGGAPILLRIAGLGHHVELEISPTATLADLKDEVHKQTGVPASYQRLVAKQKKMEDDSLVLGPSGIGLETRTKILLLHSPRYAQDKGGIETLTNLNKEIDKIDERRRSREMEDKVVQELIIQICCKIDCVETNGSDALRKMRKQTIQKAEKVAQKSAEANKRGVDP